MSEAVGLVLWIEEVILVGGLCLVLGFRGFCGFLGD